MSLPSADDLRTAELLNRLGLVGRARVEHLGMSRAGRPIDLISIGEGSRSALIVGAPHPNEPTGCLTIIRLLEKLAADGNVHEAPGWQWHFIPAIDIDGVALNQDWFRGSLTLPHYLDGFYRPPFRLQPEYSFPLELPGYRFTDETPESRCWRTALELLRPDLQCSLHGADTGGAFFILSDESSGLAERLVGLPAEFGIGVNPVGEPFANLRRHRAGVLSFPAFTDSIAQAVTQGLPAQSVWNAGDSSAGYAAKNFGTFSMTCEVPLWHDAREGCADPSGRTLGEVIDERVDLIGTDLETLTDYLPSLRSGRDSFDALALTASLEDAREMAAGAVAELRQFRPAAAQDHPLSKADLVLTESGPPGLRTLAMLVRLARVVGERSVTTALVNLLQERIRMVTRAAPLSPVPLRRATDLQIAAIIETARFLT